MKKITSFLFAVLVIAACSSVKTTQEAINSGDYDKAIRLAVKNLRESKTKKGHQAYVPMLEEAFKKVVEKEESRIEFLKKDGNPQNF